MDKTALDLLILRVQAHDDDAFSELCRLFMPLLVSAAGGKKAFSDPATASDMRIAFYKAACSYHVPGKVSFGFYAKKCLKNAQISENRKKHTAEAVCSLDDLTEKDEPRLSDDANRRLLLQEEWQKLESMKSLLSIMERKVFERYVGEVSVKDIAAELGKDRKSVENALYRALKKLRQYR